MSSSMFEVDPQGLAAILKRRPDWGAALVLELVQNAVDQRVTRVDVTLRPIRGLAEVEVIVEDDDPEGFQALSDVYTLFAPSSKRANPEARGRFNLGEKLVIATCRRAEIVTTTGAVRFDGVTRTRLPKRRTRGSRFEGVVRMSRAELDVTEATLRRVAPPDAVTLTLNGTALAPRPVVATFVAELPTEVANEEGVLCRRTRRTTVRVYDPLPGEAPTLYEMGLPVVALAGDRWDLDVGQRVPVSVERDNVTPAYLATLRVAAANALAASLRPEDATAPWVRDALAHPAVEPATVKQAVTLRFGPQAVTYDASDPEANQRAQAHGYVVVHGGHLDKEEWKNVRKVPDLLPAAGQVFPTPKPYAEGGPRETLVPFAEWTTGMRAVAEYAARLHARLFEGAVCHVRFAVTPAARWLANYGQDAATGAGYLAFNRPRLGDAWFDALLQERRIPADVDALLLHEFGHRAEGNHLADRYHAALCALGAALRRTGDIEHDIVARFCPPA